MSELVYCVLEFGDGDLVVMWMDTWLFKSSSPATYLS